MVWTCPGTTPHLKHGFHSLFVLSPKITRVTWHIFQINSKLISMPPVTWDITFLNSLMSTIVSTHIPLSTSSSFSTARLCTHVPWTCQVHHPCWCFTESFSQEMVKWRRVVYKSTWRLSEIHHKVLGVDDWVWHTETIYSSPQDPPPTTLSAKAVTDYVWENEEAIVLYQLTDNDGNTRTSGTSVPTFNGFTCGSRETYSGVGYCSSRISQSQNYTISYGSSTENVFIEVKPTPTWAQSNWIFDKYTSLWTAGGFTVPVSDTVYFSMKLPFNDVRITSGTTATMNVEIYLIQSTSTFDYDGGEFELYWLSSCTRGVTTVNNVFAFNFKANHEYLRSVIRTEV